MHWRYQSLKVIGQGGYGRSFLAYDVLSETKVVLKTAEGSSVPALKNEFVRLHRFNHPGLPAVYDLYRIKDTSILSMEYCPGETLAERLARGRMPENDAFSILNGLTAILVYIHNRGLVHGDLKPENIILNGTAVKLIDFGLSVRPGQNHTEPMVGTPAYSAPEALSGQNNITQASDIYSLGLLAYEMLSGELPRPEIRLSKNEPLIAAINDLSSGPKAEMLMRMLRYDPIERFSSAGELLATSIETGVFSQLQGINKFDYIPPHSVMRRALAVCSRSPGAMLKITGDRGSGKSTFLKEINFINQARNKDSYLINVDVLDRVDPLSLGFEPGAILLVDNPGRSADFLQRLSRDKRCKIIYSDETGGLALDPSETLTIDQVGKGAYQKTLKGCFPGMNGYDLELLDTWLLRQTGNDIGRAEKMVEYLAGGGFIYRSHTTWQVKWPDIFKGPDLPAEVRSSLEAWWQGLTEEEKKLAMDISLGQVSSRSTIEESGLKHKVVQCSGRWSIRDDQTLSLIAGKWSEGERGKLTQSLNDGKEPDEYYCRPAYKGILAQEGDWENWVRLTILLYEKAEEEKDLYGTLFHGQDLLESGKIPPELYEELAEIVSGFYCQLAKWSDALDAWKKLENRRQKEWTYWDRFFYIVTNGRILDLAEEKAGLLADNRGFGIPAVGIMAEAYGGYFKALRGDRETGEKIIRNCLKRGEESGDSDIIRVGNELMALLSYLKSDWNLIVDHWEKARNVPGTQWEKHNLIRGNAAYGIALWRLKKFAEARDAYREAMNLIKHDSPDIRLAKMSYTLGLIYFDLKDWQSAERYFESCIYHSLATGDANNLLSGMAGLGNVALKQGRISKSCRIAYEVYRLARNSGRETIGYLMNLGILENLLGNKKLGFEHVDKAEAMAGATKGFYGPEIILKTKASIEAENGDWDKAIETYKSAMLNNRNETDPEILPELALAELMRGRIAEAVVWLDRARQLKDIGPETASQIKNVAGLVKMTDPDTRQEGLEDCVAAGQEMMRNGEKYQAAKCWLQLSEAANRYNDHQAASQAMPWLFRAESEFMEMGTAGMLARAKEAIIKASRLYFTGQGKKALPTEMLKGIYRLAEIMSTEGSQATLAELSLGLAVNLSGAERGALFLLDERGKIAMAAQIDIDDQTKSDAMEFSASAVFSTANKGDIIISNDASVDQAFSSRLSVRRNVIRSLLCVPISFREGAAGAIYLDSRVTSGLFGKEQRDFVLALAGIIGSVLESSKLISRLKSRQALQPEPEISTLIIGQSKPMLQMADRIKAIARADINVLLDGESGSGKELAAQAIHRLSHRSDGKFLALDCGSLPETLLESELFGYVKGAFTGANRDKIGLFESADRGTVFLDEIASASQAVQARLLRVLESGEIRRVGESESRTVDVRVICATNKDLEIEINEGRFREDLYYRLKVITIPIPPLRERGSDILLLAEYFKDKYQNKFGKIGLKFGSEAKYQMMNYFWPGNVRELENTVQKAVLLASTKSISVKELEISSETATEKGKEIDQQKQSILEALEKFNGNISLAARSINISRRHFYRLMDKFKIKV